MAKAAPFLNQMSNLGFLGKLKSKESKTFPGLCINRACFLYLLTSTGKSGGGNEISTHHHRVME